MKIRRAKKKARVEMLPLMDVIFLLLVFFIYSMMYMAVQRGLPVNLPVSATAVPESKPSVALTIKADRSIYLDKDQVPLEVLAEALKQRVARLDLGMAEAGEPVVQIFADDSLTYGELYKVLDVVKLSRIRKISLQAKQQ